MNEKQRLLQCGCLCDGSFCITIQSKWTVEDSKSDNVTVKAPGRRQAKETRKITQWHRAVLAATVLIVPISISTATPILCFVSQPLAL